MKSQLEGSYNIARIMALENEERHLKRRITEEEEKANELRIMQKK